MNRLSAWGQFTGMAALSLGAMAQAEVTLDGTLGPAGALPGPHYVIPAEVGQRVGGNLFHSFGRFSIDTQESATFTGPATIENVIGRVTGGQASWIDGTLRSRIRGANLYLLNPAGVLFGPHATLDISGSFHVSTADYLRLGDNGVFHASHPQESVLTSAPPSAFGFLGSPPASISLADSELEVPEGETLSLVGGDIAMTGGRVAAPAGRLQLASVAAAGEVVSSEAGPQVEGFERLGNITASHQAKLEVSGKGGGRLFIRGGRFHLERSAISADTHGNRDGGMIDIHMRDSITIAGRDTDGIFSNTHGSGAAGLLSISAQTLEMDGGAIQAQALKGSQGAAGTIEMDVGRLSLRRGAQISSSTRGAGAGGKVRVQARDSITIAGRDTKGSASAIASNTYGSGKAGDLWISAETLEMDDGLIQVLAARGSQGEAGTIEMEVGRLSVRGGQISSTTAGMGKGGRVRVQARDSITIAGRNARGFTSGIFSNTLVSGAPGVLSISAATLEIGEGGEISGGRFYDDDDSEGNIGGPGKISISASSIEVNGGLISTAGLGGDAGDITVQADRVRLTRGGQMTSHTEGRGRGGVLTLKAREVSIIGQNSGLISGTTESSRSPIGRIEISADELIIKGGLVDVVTPREVKAGEIQVNARRVFLGRDDEGHQGRMRAGTTGKGAGGQISIAASEVEIDGGVISTSNFSKGNGESATGDAGGITVRADWIHVTRGGQMTSDTEGSGRGGNIYLTARQVRLQDGGTFSASSRGTGRAGDIVIGVLERFESQGGAVTTESERAGGGSIEIRAGQSVFLQDSPITTTVRGGGGDAGNITIDSRSVILNRSQISANAFEGAGGNIRIMADYFVPSADSQVDASSSLGIDGTVEISALDVDMSATEGLPVDFFDAPKLLRERCARRRGKVSSFIVIKHEGLPPEPDALLSGSYVGKVRAKGELQKLTGIPSSRWALDKRALWGCKG